MRVVELMETLANAVVKNPKVDVSFIKFNVSLFG